MYAPQIFNKILWHLKNFIHASPAWCYANKGFDFIILTHISAMATIFPPRLKILCDTCKARKLSLHTRPYVTLSLFITTISISCLLSPDIKYLGAGAENTSSVIHIGALVSYDTINGRAARTAIQMAVDSINKDNNILNNSELVLHMLDTNCSAFLGVAAGKL